MLNPLYTAVSWVLLRWHQLFSHVLDGRSGLTWAISIVFLVVTIRVLLFRFFIKQVHNQRKMQEMQPKIAALREKYKGDRQQLSQEMMKLQKEEGFNPLGGCLPIALQTPVFIALFHVLRLIGGPHDSALWKEYHWTASEVSNAGHATLFHAPIAAAFSDKRNLASHLVGANPTATKIVAAVLVLCMVAATYTTQRQIMARSGQVLDGQQAAVQKMLLYGMPASLLVSGFFFPIGVLLYWFANNLWTMGQQFYILRRMPHPNATTTDRPAGETAKALAPRPGQKPVNPKRRALPSAGATSSTDASAAKSPADGSPADGSPDGTVPGATPAASSGTGRAAKSSGPAGAGSGTGSAPAKGSGTAARKSGPAKPGTPEAGSPDPAATPAGTGSDGADGAAPGASTPSAGPAGPARPARRPTGQRSSTTTRPKKKRR